MTAVAGIIGGIAAIVGAVYGLFKWFSWKYATSPEDAREGVDEEVQKKKKAVEDGGRPV